MNLRATHYGYAYQDLITGIALVDLMLGAAERITVDTKGAPGDLFDDLTVRYKAGRRVRMQIKHTTQNRQLSKETFSADGRSLRLDLLFRSLMADLEQNPGTTYRVIVRDGNPDEDLAAVLKPVATADDPGDPLPGLATRRFKFDPKALQQIESWKRRLNGLSEAQIKAACEILMIDTSAPAASLDFSAPGAAERILLRRLVEELGAGRVPNTAIQPEYAALALVHAATGARSGDGDVARESLLPRIGLTTDFGAVAEGHPIEVNVVVPRTGAAAEVHEHVDVVASVGGRVVVTGEPGVGKSWLCEALADAFRAEDWIVARHHCWLGAADVDRDERVLTDVVIGSLLQQLEQIVPEATTNLRPRFAATAEALTAAVQDCRVSQPRRRILLIVDGLDHVDRVLGRSTNQQADPSRLLVEQLAAIDLPPGVCMLIASQPGPHLAGAEPAAEHLVRMPRMSWEEVRALATKQGLLTDLGVAEPLGNDDERAIVDLVYDRSGGNALYATYLCRYATGISPLNSDAAPSTVNDVVQRLKRVPDTATDIDAYYQHLLSALTDGQLFTIGTLAMCDFALSAEELCELVSPMIRPLVSAAIATLAPVLNSQPGLGGLRIHHESFSQHILRDKDDVWVRSVRQSVAGWLAGRGFFTDARAFRHLPELLARLDRYQELKVLIEPGFVAEAIRAFQPPEALQRVVTIVARESETRLDWPTLITCVETRKSIDTYETESLPDTLVEYADVVVAILGPDVVADRLMYEGRPTFPPGWGLRLCRTVDLAGAAAPWKAYLAARDRESSRERRADSSDHDGTLHLAVQLGALRLRTQRGDIPSDLAEQIAEYLGLDHKASLDELVEVFTAGLPPGTMPDVAAAITDPVKAARVYLTLADLAAAGTPGLPEPAELARRAWALAPALDIAGYLNHDIPAADVLAGLGTLGLEAELLTATGAIIKNRVANHGDVQRWLSLLALAHAIDRAIPLRCASQLAGVGFYRAWLRYAVATIGIAHDVEVGFTTAEDASTAVRVALGDLAAEAHPFTGNPRACDLYSIHPLIHEVIETSLTVVRPSDLDTVLAYLIAIGDGTTTTTNFGLPEGGPLVTNDLLEILARLSDHIGVDSVHALMRVVRDRRRDSSTQYRITANFELATARICVDADAKDEADDCWRRASLLLASYGGHKDPTISEIIDSVEDLVDVDVDAARRCLQNLVDLVYLVRQHTNGRDTSHFVNRWWEKAATIDPIAVGIDGADTLLAELGFEDSRAYTAHTSLLTGQMATADPIVLAALRLTTGTGWRDPTTDRIILTRLAGELGSNSQADVLLTIAANNVAATYDDQAMLYSNDQPKSVATPELVNAVVKLGGAAFPARTPRPDQKPNSRWDAKPKPDPLKLQKRIVTHQRPNLPAGRAGAVLVARAFDAQRYRDDADSAWSLDSVTNAIGWRIIEETLAHGAEAGMRLLDDVVHEISPYSDNEVFAALGEGLAVRCNNTGDPLKTVASYCLTLAYTRIRGGGGWRTFASRERTNLWTKAHQLDALTAEKTLAAAIATTVSSDAQRTYGATQAVVAAFAVTPPGTTPRTAVECWDAAFSVIQHRLPGVAERGDHTYHPKTAPDSQDALDCAVATLALATISQPLRVELRQNLVAAALLLACRPRTGQVALAHVLRSRLDAGRTTWLLEVMSVCLPAGELTEEMAAELTKLAQTDWLSVRALAAQILASHGRPVPDPPATEPAPQVRAAFHRLYGEDE